MLRHSIAVFILLACPIQPVCAQDAPLAGPDLIFAEQDGILAVEAEHFYKQTQTEMREWNLHTTDGGSSVEPDGDPSHARGASGGAYIEVLPDTRRTHDDRLIPGENFSNEPGKLAVLHYRVSFENPGRYYVWVRAYSTGSEDNGIHVGLDGAWPDHGQRMQWCNGKQQWWWESKQRTQEEHCGVPHEIYLDIEEPGEHEITFSLREDGFEFDKFLLTNNREFGRPDDVGPEPRVLQGNLPAAFKFLPAKTDGPAETPRGEPAAAPEKPASTEPQEAASVHPREADGQGGVQVTGELKQWHKISLTLDGPFASEHDSAPNPFTDYALVASFQHSASGKKYDVPGFFAADGHAAESGAESGTKWRVHFAPDRSGTWNYSLHLLRGEDVALGEKGESLSQYSTQGTFDVSKSDKQAPDFRARGRLEYVGQHYLRFAGSGEYFLKAGPDAPETLLAYADFDGTQAHKDKVPLKTWKPHVRDWAEGDPSWRGGRGKGLIGALNYLASKGCNVFSFLPYNAGGDGDNVWPFVSRDDKMHYDCSKLDQWGIVFDHATRRGLYLHFKLQENEIDDNRHGQQREAKEIAESLDGGKLGRERKLYCRELIARFGHALALNWNLGEENTQSPAEQRDMINYLWETDPYQHSIVVHTFPSQQDRVYTPLLGDKSRLTGASLQNSWSQAHQRTLKWRELSGRAGRPWVVCNDEQNPAAQGVPPDPGYQGHDGNAEQNGKRYNLHDIRKRCLWGTLLAGGAGVEYYFGYKLPQNDLLCEDFRSRDQSWDQCRIALDFFRQAHIPFWEMRCLDELVQEGHYCFTKPGVIYLVYLPDGGDGSLAVSEPSRYQLEWFNPRHGGSLRSGELKPQTARVEFTAPDGDDWLAVIRKQ